MSYVITIHRLWSYFLSPPIRSCRAQEMVTHNIYLQITVKTAYHKVSFNSFAELWSRDAEVYAVMMITVWLNRGTEYSVYSALSVKGCTAVTCFIIPP